MVLLKVQVTAYPYVKEHGVQAGPDTNPREENNPICGTITGISIQQNFLHKKFNNFYSYKSTIKALQQHISEVYTMHRENHISSV